jgi:SAM-dependent methyltransferase
MNATTEGIDQDPAPTAWFEDDSFWESSFPYLFSDEKFASAEEQVSQLAKLTGSPFSRVLDLCCGPGRHAIPLAKQGALVTGVDRSSFLLEKARSRAGSEGIEWVQEDMRTFVRPSQFDLVINLFTSFGYFGSAEEDLAVLRNAYSSLVPGGFFAIDLMGKEILARRFTPSTVEEQPDGSVLVQKREIIQDWGRIKVQWLLIQHNQVTRIKFDHALYSGRELTDLLRAAGFENVRLSGTWQGAPYDVDAERLIAVAAKPA